MRSWLARPLAALAFAPALACAALYDEIQVYDDDINAPGEFGLELHTNASPSARGVPDYPGEGVPAHHFRFTPEFSYGITRTWEAGLYLPSSFDSSGHGSLGGGEPPLQPAAGRGYAGPPA